MNIEVAVFALLFLIFNYSFTHRLIAAEGADRTINLSQNEIVGGAPLAVATQASASGDVTMMWLWKVF